MGLQIRSCTNCSNNPDDQFKDPKCGECWEFNQWQSKRGRPSGSKPKPGSKKTGPKEFEDRGELKQIITLSFTEKDIIKAGGIAKVKEYLTKAFYKIKEV